MRKLKTLFTILFLAVLGLGNVWAADSYVQLQSIADIDESADYVLGVDGTGFHFSGTSSWGACSKPSDKTPLTYKLKKATDGRSFTAQTTISNKEYFLQVPTTNTFSMVETSASSKANIDLIIGTTQVSGTNYAVANKGTTARHLRINGTSGLRSYAGTTGTMAFFYKVVSAGPTLSSIAVSGAPTKTVYEAGEEFDPAGLTVTGTYSDNSTETITEGITWSESAALTEGQTSVSVTATVGGKTSAAYTVNGLTVNAHVVTAGTYNIVPNNAFFNCNAFTTKPAGFTTATGSQDDITVLYTAASSAYINDAQCRMYSGTKLTFTAPDGFEITAIAFTADGTNWAGTHTSNAGSMTDNKHWTGAAEEVTITFGGTCRCTKITVTYAEHVAASVATPELSVAAGTYEGTKNVKVSNYDAAISYFYTLDGTAPTNASTAYDHAAGIDVAASATLKVIAYDAESNASDVASAAYVIIPVYASIAELLAAGDPTTTGWTVKVTLTDVAITSFQKNTNKGVWVGDIELFGGVAYPETWAVGGKLSGTLTCTWKLYGTTKELCPSDWTGLAYTAPETPIEDPEYASLAVLIEEEGAPIAGGKNVKVTFTNDVITRITDDRKGIFFMVGEQEVEVYCSSTTCPTDWTVNGQVSGTFVEGEWILYTPRNGEPIWEIKVADWTAFEYTAYVSHVTGVTFANASVFAGKTLDIATLVEIAPADASNKNVAFEIVSGSEFITLAEGVVTGVAEGAAVVRVTTEDGSFTADATITVEAVSVWATTYTSNVTLSTTGGTSATASKVKVNGEETQYDAIKAGTGSADGKIKVTLPLGTTKLHFHAVTWSGSAATATLSVKKDGDATELFGNVIRPNTGLSSNSPYTLAGDPTDDYYSINFGSALTEATTFVFDASVDRFAIYGVNVEKVNVELLSIAVSGTATKTEYEVGDVFDPAGLVVTGTYNIGEPQAITEGVEWSFDPATLAAGTTSVSVVATVGEKSSEALVVNGLNVVVAPLHATWVAEEQGYENETEVTSAVLVANAVNATFDAGSKYYNTGKAIRVYGGKSFTISAYTGITLTKIVLTYGTGDATTNAISTDCGTFVTNTWTGEASSVKFTEAGTSGQRRIAGITVYYSGEIAGKVICGNNAYETLAAAIAAEENGTITLLEDLNENIVVPVGKTFTLDLNGHTLNGAQAASTATIKNLGTLTIENGTVERAGAGSASYYIIENYGTMTLNCNVEGSASASLIRNNAAEAKMTFVGGEYTQTGNFIVVKNDLGEVIVNDGIFSTAADKNVLNNWDQMTINGGTFNGCILNGAYDTNNNTLVINDGTFNTDKIRTYLGNGQTDANIEIKGGEFTSESLVYQGPTSANDAQVAISGGTFHTAVPAIYCAEDFQPLDNGDGTYGVQEAIKVVSIVLGGEYAQSFTVGDEFAFGGTVTAKYNREKADAIVTSDATFTGYDMNTLGKQTVTVSYTEDEVTVETTYQITVKADPATLTEETVDFAEAYSGQETGKALPALVTTSFTITYAQGTAQNNVPKYFKSESEGDKVHVYTGNTVTITASKNIYLVEVTFVSKKYSNLDEAVVANNNHGYYVSDGSSKTVTFTNSDSEQARITNITVYYEDQKEEVRGGLVEGKFGTICVEKMTLAPAGAHFYTLNQYDAANNILTVNENTTGRLEAGVPYIFEAEGANIEGIVVAEDEDAKGNNGLYAVLNETFKVTADDSGIYGIVGDEVRPAAAGATFKAGRCYIKLDEVSTVGSSAPSRAFRVVRGTNVTTGFEALEAVEGAVKVIVNGELYILRDGKTYNVSGCVVK